MRFRAVLCLLAAMALAGPALPQDSPRAPDVAARKIAMNDARAALERLTDMAALRVPFDRRQARGDARALVRFSRSLPRLFRKARLDGHSRARPEIWSSWPAFRQRARDARRAAGDIDARSLSGVQAGVPRMLGTCLACHDQFREGG